MTKSSAAEATPEEKTDATPDAPAEPTSEKATDVVEKPEAKPTLEAVVSERAHPVTFSRFSLEVENNTVHRCNVPIGTTPEQCMDEEFWTHVGQRMIPGDTIRVLPDDMKWELVLHVYNCGPLFAHVTQKHFYELVPAHARRVVPSRYTTDYAGTTKKWRFLRDGEMMRDGFATEELAQRAAKNHQAAVARQKPKQD